MVLMSERGVVDIILGDSRVEMLSGAMRRFPRVGLIPDRAVHSSWVAAVVRRVELPESEYAIPVDLGCHCLVAAG